MKKLLVLALMLPTLLFGQDKQASKVCEGSFSQLEADGGYTIFIRQGSPSKVEAIAEGKALDNLVCEIANNTLRISSTYKYKMGKKDKIQLFVTIENPKTLRLNGATELVGKNTLVAPNLKIQMSGASEAKLHIESPNVSMELSGASEAEIKGVIQTLSIDLSGASEFSGKYLDLEVGKARLSGASEVNFGPKKELRVEASGASEVKCFSSPAVKEVSLTGASELNYVKD
jgi:hypothetical protein